MVVSGFHFQIVGGAHRSFLVCTVVSLGFKGMECNKIACWHMQQTTVGMYQYIPHADTKGKNKRFPWAVNENDKMPQPFPLKFTLFPEAGVHSQDISVPARTILHAKTCIAWSSKLEG